MKKFINALLAFVLVFALAVPAFAAEDTTQANAATRLQNLDILKGYEDGSLGLDKDITRAEFATIAVRLLGLEDAAELAKASTPFSDVAATHWASGYVNIAVQQGLLKGYPDGTFKPSQNVSGVEALAILVRVLGYEPAVTGVWPSNYIVKAAQIGLSDGAKFDATKAAPRGLVALFADNALEIPKMVQTGYGDSLEYVVSGSRTTVPVETLLDKDLGLDKVDAKVVSVDTDDKEISVLAKEGTTYSKNETYSYLESLTVAGTENAIVTLWVNGDVVVSLKVESTVIYDYVDKINGADSNKTDSLVEKVKLLNSGVTYSVNALEVIEDGDSSATVLKDNAFAKFILKDGKIETIEMFTIAEAGLITDVTDAKLSYVKGSAARTIRNLDDADKIIVVVNGKLAKYSDLKEGMYFDYAEYKTKEHIFVATDKSVSGELDRVKTTEVRIGGTYYDLASPYYFSTDNGDNYDTGALADSDLFGEDVVAFLNLKGEVAYVKADVEETTTDFYGFLISYTAFSKQVRVAKDVDGELDEVILATDDLYWSGATLQYKNASGTLTTAVAGAYSPNNVYKFTLNEDGKVVEITDPITGSPILGDAFAASYINDNAGTGVTNTKYYVKDSVVVFDISDPTDPQLLKWDDIKDTDITTDDLEFYVDANPAKLVVITDTNGVTLGSSDLEFGIVNSLASISKDNYEVKVTLLDGTEYYTISKSKATGVDANDIVAFKYVTDSKIETVADATYADLSAVAAKDSDWDAVSASTIDEGSIDGKYFKVGTTLYKLASDALVYEVVFDGASVDEYKAADLSDIDDEGSVRDNVSFITVKGEVKLLFFWN